MARVTSQKIRQAILATGDPLDLDGPMPDKLQLFDALGEPLALTGAQVYADEGDPDPLLGAEGDFYLDTLTNHFWQKQDTGSEVEWVDIAILGQEPPGYQGTWNVATDYIPGDTVRYLGKLYGTIVDNVGNDPSIVAGNWGSPAATIQAKTSDKVDDGVEYTKTFDALSPVNNFYNGRTIPIAIDGVSGSAVNLGCHIENNASEHIVIRVAEMNGSLAAGGAISGTSVVAPGASQDMTLNFATFVGGSGDYILLICEQSSPAGITGDVNITLTGTNLNGPPSFPWDLLSAS